jgi:hypothetical protein
MGLKESTLSTRICNLYKDGYVIRTEVENPKNHSFNGAEKYRYVYGFKISQKGLDLIKSKMTKSNKKPRTDKQFASIHNNTSSAPNTDKQKEFEVMVGVLKENGIDPFEISFSAVKESATPFLIEKIQNEIKQKENDIQSLKSQLLTLMSYRENIPSYENEFGRLGMTDLEKQEIVSASC